MPKQFIAGIGWIDLDSGRKTSAPTDGVKVGSSGGAVSQDTPDVAPRPGSFRDPNSQYNRNAAAPIQGTRPASGPVIVQRVDGQRYYAGSPEFAAARKAKSDRFRNASREAASERRDNGWTKNSDGKIVAPDGSITGPNGLLYGPLAGAPGARQSHAAASFKAGAFGVDDPSKATSSPTNPFGAGGIFDPKSGFGSSGTSEGGGGTPNPTVAPPPAPPGDGAPGPGTTQFPPNPPIAGGGPSGDGPRPTGGHEAAPYARPIFGEQNQAQNVFDNLFNNVGGGGSVADQGNVGTVVPGGGDQAAPAGIELPQPGTPAYQNLIDRYLAGGGAGPVGG